MGLDKPLPVQYWRWLTRVAHGGPGKLASHPSSSAERDPGGARGNTFMLALSAACMGFTLGVTLGTIAAFFQGDGSIRWPVQSAITGVSLPHYWVAIMLIIIFLGHLELATGDGDAGDRPAARHALDPAPPHGPPSIALSLIPMGVITRMVRASVLEILQQDFVLTLRAKGLWIAHGDAACHEECRPPVLTLMGLQFGYLLAALCSSRPCLVGRVRVSLELWRSFSAISRCSRVSSWC